MTKLEIINSALIHSGAERVDSLEAMPSKSLGIALHQFDVSRQILLRLHQWNFAIFRDEIEADTEPPGFEFERRYSLPPDFLRLSSIYDSHGVAYQIEGRKIFTDLGSPLALVYVRDIPDPDDWDPIFSDAVACHIASKIAFALTADMNLVGQLDAMCERSMSRAKWADSTDNSRKRVTANLWLSSRYGWTTQSDRFHSITAEEEPFFS